MIDEPTCLILGAGASAPYGLPIGGDLRELILVKRSPYAAQIAQNYPVKSPLAASDRRMGNESPMNNWSIFLERVAAQYDLLDCLNSFWDKFFAADRDIDWFLRHNDHEFGRIARLHIAAVLLNCEDETRLSGDWYRALLSQIFETTLDSFEEGKLSIITFNYDRSFERYFTQVLQNLYRLRDDEAAKFLSRIPIKHVYGSLGSLEEVKFGDITRIDVAASSIKLVRPQVDQQLQDELGSIIRAASYVNFIGFGFDEDNIAQLGASNFKGKRIFSTSRGTTEARRQKIRKLLPEVRFPIEKGQVDSDAANLLASKDLFGPKIPAPRPVATRRPEGRRRGWRIGWRI